MQHWKFLFAIVVFSTSCDRYHEGESERKIKFNAFLKKFQPITLPFKASTACYSPDSVTSIKLDPETDSLFIEKHEWMSISVGVLPDTSNYYKIIYCVAAACWMPKLAIYSKDGKLLSKENIGKGCGADCGYICSDTLEINSMSDITQTYTEEFYSCSDEKTKNWKKTAEIIKYSIDKSGKINTTSEFKLEKR